MPLNFKNTEEGGETAGRKEGPPIHEPKSELSRRSKAVIAIIVVVIVSAGLIVMDKTGMFGTKAKPPAGTVITQGDDTAVAAGAAEGVATEPGAEQAGKPEAGNSPSKIAGGPSPDKSTVRQAPQEEIRTGGYTIYIGSYRARSIADQEAGRWSEAGYLSFVSEFSGTNGKLFRVCLGRYGSTKEARQLAERLNDAFEGGYWIGSLQ